MTENVDILIAGSGFAGLGMAIQLRKAGIESFLVIEKGDDVGGTWRENRYPGCACDIASHLYSFSFDCNPGWSRMYAPQEEIWEYLRVCARRHGVLPYIRFHTRLYEAVWDEAEETWNVVTNSGTIRARVLISAMGALHEPRLPELAGAARFQGPQFHTAAWEREARLEGQNIAVVGTGASAVQVAPRLAPLAGRLYIFQRTPAWIVPKIDFEIPERWKRRFRRIPGLMRLFRILLFWSLELRLPAFLGNGWMRRQAAKMALRHMEKQIADPKLRAALTPRYEFGCKRVLPSSDFYPTLNRPNVELVTAPIAEVRERSIVTVDGVERPLDVLIYATGFRATELLHGARVVGRGGIDFDEAWRRSKSALLGITMSGLPNFFMLLGPNTGLGHNSVVLMIEAQIRYIMSCLELMRRERRAVMELRSASQQAFGEWLRKRLAPTVWQSGGCRSWYQDPETGENPVIWPGSVSEYRRLTRKARPQDYVFSGA